jgi:hypothetical protein
MFRRRAAEDVQRRVAAIAAHRSRIVSALLRGQAPQPQGHTPGSLAGRGPPSHPRLPGARGRASSLAIRQAAELRGALGTPGRSCATVSIPAAGFCIGLDVAGGDSLVCRPRCGRQPVLSRVLLEGHAGFGRRWSATGRWLARRKHVVACWIGHLASLGPSAGTGSPRAQRIDRTPPRSGRRSGHGEMAGCARSEAELLQWKDRNRGRAVDHRGVIRQADGPRSGDTWGGQCARGSARNHRTFISPESGSNARSHGVPRAISSGRELDVGGPLARAAASFSAAPRGARAGWSPT